MDADRLMEFASATAIEAGRITQSHFESVAVEFKTDGSEVTKADRAAEEYIISAISEAFPEDALLGEEGALRMGGGSRRWIVDPIDGTRSFASGVPLYGILIALEETGVPVLGCCHFPALDETLVAATGAGCWRNGRPARVSDCDRLSDARIVTSGLEYWRDWATPAGRAGFERLLDESRFARTWGDCFGYALIATGRAEVFVDPASGASWDYAPMVPIIAEAGGRYTRIDGGPIAAWTTALASNGRVHAAASSCWNAAADDLIQTSAVTDRRG